MSRPGYPVRPLDVSDEFVALTDLIPRAGRLVSAITSSWVGFAS